MQLLAATAEQVGFWGDKLISIVGITFCLIVGGALAGKKRRGNTERIEQLEAEREADLRHDGPPRFNG